MNERADSAAERRASMQKGLQGRVHFATLGRQQRQTIESQPVDVSITPYLPTCSLQSPALHECFIYDSSRIATRVRYRAVPAVAMAAAAPPLSAQQLGATQTATPPSPNTWRGRGGCYRGSRSVRNNTCPGVGCCQESAGCSVHYSAGLGLGVRRSSFGVKGASVEWQVLDPPVFLDFCLMRSIRGPCSSIDHFFGCWFGPGF